MMFRGRCLWAVHRCRWDQTISSNAPPTSNTLYYFHLTRANIHSLFGGNWNLCFQHAFDSPESPSEGQGDESAPAVSPFYIAEWASYLQSVVVWMERGKALFVQPCLKSLSTKSVPRWDSVSKPSSMTGESSYEGRALGISDMFKRAFDIIFPRNTIQSDSF